MAKSPGQRCGDIELPAYLSNAVGPVPLVLDLGIAHDHWGSSSNPSLDDHLHYPDYNNRPSHAIFFMTASSSWIS